MAGQNGQRRSAERVRIAFCDVGLRNPHLEEFPDSGVVTRGVTSRVSGSVDRIHPLIRSNCTPQAHHQDTLRGHRCMLEPERTEKSRHADRLRGLIVVASSRAPDRCDRWLHRMEKNAQTAEAGAAGFVFRNYVEGALPPTRKAGYHNRPEPILTIGVSKKIGFRWRSV